MYVWCISEHRSDYFFLKLTGEGGLDATPKLRCSRCQSWTCAASFSFQGVCGFFTLFFFLSVSVPSMCFLLRYKQQPWAAVKRCAAHRNLHQFTWERLASDARAMLSHIRNSRQPALPYAPWPAGTRWIYVPLNLDGLKHLTVGALGNADKIYVAILTNHCLYLHLMKLKTTFSNKLLDSFTTLKLVASVCFWHPVSPPCDNAWWERLLCSGHFCVFL